MDVYVESVNFRLLVVREGATEAASQSPGSGANTHCSD
jgi:hypothetical protein